MAVGPRDLQGDCVAWLYSKIAGLLGEHVDPKAVHPFRRPKPIPEALRRANTDQFFAKLKAGLGLLKQG